MEHYNTMGEAGILAKGGLCEEMVETCQKCKTNNTHSDAFQKTDATNYM